MDERILEEAANVFLEEGFARAKVDEIASRAGITKQTVYARFPSKSALFGALASRFSGLAFRPLHVAVNSKQSPRAHLIQFATEVTAVLRDPKSQRLFVVLAAEARSFPDLASQTWVKGAGRLRTHLRGFFDEQIALKRMAISNPGFAVEQFLGLLVGPIFGRLLFERPAYFESDKHAATYIEAAVDLFLAKYLTSAGRRACRHSIRSTARG
ncbi:MAG TPA: TetR/AcrR family transcriptional regulator [Terracidiphilus sp.]|nr:TetR/AcrR family transcriptional regulator [Terracidiphilus sp.]